MKVAVVLMLCVLVMIACAGPASAQDQALVAARSVIDAPIEPNAGPARSELYRLIHELQTLKFSDASAEKTSAKKQSAPATAEPNKPASTPRVADANAVVISKAAAQAKQIALAPSLLQDVNSVANPFELAELFYKIGNRRDAAACYQAALRKMEPDKAKKSSEPDRAWVLFQIGNCLAQENPTEAVKAYKQLIGEYPASEWTQIAVSREQLIQWYIACNIAPKAQRSAIEKRQ